MGFLWNIFRETEEGAIISWFRVKFSPMAEPSLLFFSLKTAASVPTSLSVSPCLLFQLFSRTLSPVFLLLPWTLSLPLSVSLCLSSITQCIPLQDSQFSCSFIILLNKKHVWTDSFKKVQSGREDMSWPITYHIFSVTLGTSRIWTDTCHLLLHPVSRAFCPIHTGFCADPWACQAHLRLVFSPWNVSLKCFPWGLLPHLLPFLTKVMFPRRPQISIPDISSRLSLQHLALSNIVCVLLTCLFYIHFPFIKHRKVGSFVFYFYTTLL